MKIGILGGGQLGQMLALAGKSLGHTFVFLDPAPDAPARAQGLHLCGSYEDQKLLTEFAELVDVISCEFENVPTQSLKFLAKLKPVLPNPDAFTVGRNRVNEKLLFAKLGIPAADFFELSSNFDLPRAAAKLGDKFVIKTCEFGYDGKGQQVVKSANDLKAAQITGPSIAEKFIEFTRELSQIAVRAEGGEMKFYPLVENIHTEGILFKTTVPANVSKTQDDSAQQYVRAIAESLNYVGVLALEMFEVQGKLYANELAPRVHNTGHWSIEGAKTSQFENHLRAISDLPLGDTEAIGFCAMLNIIGKHPDLKALKKINSSFIHLYGKQERPGRKLGHVTVVTQLQSECTAVVEQIKQVLRNE